MSPLYLTRDISQQYCPVELISCIGETGCFGALLAFPSPRIPFLDFRMADTAWTHERLPRLDGMHLHLRLLAALMILLGGMYEFWRTGRVTGLELLLEPDSGGI
jgi:hypothetical protein